MAAVLKLDIEILTLCQRQINSSDRDDLVRVWLSQVDASEIALLLLYGLCGEVPAARDLIMSAKLIELENVKALISDPATDEWRPDLLREIESAYRS